MTSLQLLAGGIAASSRSRRVTQGTSFDVGKALQRLWTRMFPQQVVEVPADIEAQQQQDTPAAAEVEDPVTEAPRATESQEASALAEPPAAEAKAEPAEPQAAVAAAAPTAPAVPAQPEEAPPAARYEVTCISDISQARPCHALPFCTASTAQQAQHALSLIRCRQDC